MTDEHEMQPDQPVERATAGQCMDDVELDEIDAALKAYHGSRLEWERLAAEGELSRERIRMWNALGAARAVVINRALDQGSKP